MKDGFSDIAESLSGYLKAQFELGKLSVKGLIWKSVVWFGTMIVAISSLVAAVICLFYGASMGLAQWLQRPPWAGFLFVGLVSSVSIFLWFRFKQRTPQKKIYQKEILDNERRLMETAGQLFVQFDPRPWTEEHPLPSAGIAVVTGFVVFQVASSSLLSSIGSEILKNALLPVLTAQWNEWSQKKDQEPSEEEEKISNESAK
jgi:membrane protein implicated in regulation of membrane protease activity